MEFAPERAMGDAWLVRRKPNGRMVTLKLAGAQGETLVELECLLGGWQAALPRWAATLPGKYGTPWEAAKAALAAAAGMDGAEEAFAAAGHALDPPLQLDGLEPSRECYGARMEAPEVSCGAILAAQGGADGLALLECAGGLRASVGAATLGALRCACCDAACDEKAAMLGESDTPARWAARAVSREPGAPIRAFAASRGRLESGALKGRWADMPCDPLEATALIATCPDLQCVAVDDGLALPAWVRRLAIGAPWGDAAALLGCAARAEASALSAAGAMAAALAAAGSEVGAAWAAAILNAAPTLDAHAIANVSGAPAAFGRKPSDAELVGWDAASRCGLASELESRRALKFFDFGKYAASAAPGAAASEGWIVRPAEAPRKPEPGDWAEILGAALEEPEAAEPEQLSLFGDAPAPAPSRKTGRTSNGKTVKAAKPAAAPVVEASNAPAALSRESRAADGTKPAAAAESRPDADCMEENRPEASGEAPGGASAGDSLSAEEVDREVSEAAAVAAPPDDSSGGAQEPPGDATHKDEPAEAEVEAKGAGVQDSPQGAADGDVSDDATGDARGRTAPAKPAPGQRRRQRPQRDPRPKARQMAHFRTASPQAGAPAQKPAPKPATAFKPIKAARGDDALPSPPPQPRPTPMRDRRESERAMRPTTRQGR